MLKALERVLVSRIKMYEMFIASRYALEMDASDNIHKKEECETLLRIVRTANKEIKK